MAAEERAVRPDERRGDAGDERSSWSDATADRDQGGPSPADVVLSDADGLQPTHGEHGGTDGEWLGMTILAGHTTDHRW